MDLVYPVKRGGEHHELRYSMRSLTNLPHDQVWVAGAFPSWGSDQLRHIKPRKPGPAKHSDLAANVLAACRNPEVSDPFVLMNDDFFIMKSIPEIPEINRGLSVDVERSPELMNRSNPLYLEAMIHTRECLEKLGYSDVLCFELHTPMVVYKDIMMKAYEPASVYPRWHNRTAYGAFAGLSGRTVEDVKVYSLTDLPDLSWTFVSTSDKTFQDGVVGKHIRNRFDSKSPYEQ